MRAKGILTLTAILLVSINLQIGCSKGTGSSAFKYDKGAFSQAKPWTSENFKNNPNNFQFAIIGDRSGGANVHGTYERSMDQLNMMQPEFVMSVGDFIEGYTNNQDELNREWDEFQGIVGRLQMPFFYVKGNHDVNFPATKEAWRERFGPGYYSFICKNVLFVALDTEDAPRKFPPNMERDIATFNRLKREDPAMFGAYDRTPHAGEANKTDEKKEERQ